MFYDIIKYTFKRIKNIYSYTNNIDLINYLNLLIYFISLKMMDAVLRTPPILSKLLDTLCLEMSVNKSDENSLGLIE